MSLRPSTNRAFSTCSYGMYHDVYRRQDGRWKFARRDYQSLARTSPDFDVFPHPRIPF